MNNRKRSALVALVALLVCAVLADAGQKQSKRPSKSNKAATQKASKPQEATEAQPSNPSATPHASAPSEAEIERITVDELKEKIAKNEPLTIIDSRSQGSYDGSETKVKGAVRITADEVPSRLKEIPRDKEIVIYCT